MTSRRTDSRSARGFSRRSFLLRSAAAAPIAAFAPGVFLRAARGAPGGSVRNLVLLELFGGNDGFNTIVPWNVDGGVYYGEYRPQIGIPDAQLLKVPGEPVAFHPALSGLKGLFDQGRVAVVQGVSYPDPSYSHEVARRIWYTGDPTAVEPEGWLARFLNLFPEPAFPCAAEIDKNLSGLVLGADAFVPAIDSIGDFQFPIDHDHWKDGANRRAAYAAMVQALKAQATDIGGTAGTADEVLGLIETLSAIPEPAYVGEYPEHYFAKDLKLVVRLLAADLGLRVFHLGYGGFDTHSEQDSDGHHTHLLDVLSKGVTALQADLVQQGLDQDTLIVVFSEFGRTVYENGSLGTDHGSVMPVFVVGNGVDGGFANAHPPMALDALDGDGEPPRQADVRDVLGDVLTKWLGGTPQQVAGLFPGHAPTDLGFLP